MKKIASLLAVATSIFVVALPSSAQVIPIVSGSITINGVRNGNGGFDITIPASNLLTPAGTVSLTTIANYTYTGVNGANNFSLTSTSFNTSITPFFFPASSTLTGDANGSLAGTPFTMNRIVITTSRGGGSYNNPNNVLSRFSFGFNIITGGSLTPPAAAPVTSTDFLTVRPDLRIANSRLQFSALNKPEYQGEYKNDFSRSSFDGDRILGGLPNQ